MFPRSCANDHVVTVSRARAKNRGVRRALDAFRTRVALRRRGHRPTGVGCRLPWRGEQAAGPARPFAHQDIHPPPLGRCHEQRSAVLAAEHASEACLPGVDGVEHVAASSHPYALPARDAGEPDRAVGVCTDAVGCLFDLSSDPSAGECAIGGDVESDELRGVRIGHDKRATAVDQRHTVRPPPSVGDLPHAAVAADEHHYA